MDARLEFCRFKHKLGLWRRWLTRPPSDYQPLFVIASCRSGSNLLLSHLRQQPGVNMRGELLYPGTPFGIARYNVPRASAIKHIRLSLHAEHSAIRGCKLMTYQLRNCKLDVPMLSGAFPTAKYIVLYRQDIAKQFVSQQLAEATRQFMLLPGQEPKAAKVRIDPDELNQYADLMRRDYRKVLNNEWLRPRSVLLSYEELVHDPVYWLESHIGPLLGVLPVQPREELLKQNSSPLSEKVSNYPEVRDLLENCRHSYIWPASKRQAA